MKKKPAINGRKSRKDIRKEKRLEKKKRKLDYYVNRNKPGKHVLVTNKTPVDTDKPKKPKNVQKKVIDQQTKDVMQDRKKQNKLEKEMQKQRKRQMQEANVEEDRIIKRLEKDLKLHKRKTKSIPKSFASDGLDCILFFIKNICNFGFF